MAGTGGPPEGLGIAVGSSALGPGEASLAPLLDSSGLPVVQRHAGEPYRPPHLIDHAANMTSLAAAGCDRVLAISSVGSTRPELGVGTIVCPHDYIAIADAVSASRGGEGHGTRDLAGPWRDALLAGWARCGAGPIVDRAVYWQSRGPRFETPAEVAFIAPHAELVGMTVASECVAALEAGLEYAAICVVDNLANGLGDEALTLEEFERGKAAGVAGLAAGLELLLPALREVAA